MCGHGLVGVRLYASKNEDLMRHYQSILQSCDSQWFLMHETITGSLDKGLVPSEILIVSSIAMTWYINISSMIQMITNVLSNTSNN